MTYRIPRRGFQKQLDYIQNALNELENAVEPNLLQAVRDIKQTYGDTVSIEQKSKRLEKWGRNESVGTAGASIMTLQDAETEETLINTNGITSVVSTSASDTQTLSFYEGHTYDSGNLTFVNENNGGSGITLTGQTPVTLPTAIARANRARLSTPANGDIAFYQGGTVTSGKPDNDDQVHLIIPTGDRQTQKASTSISKNDYWIINEGNFGVLEKTSAFVQFRIEIKPASEGNDAWFPIMGWVPASASSGSVPIFTNGGYIIVPKNHDVRAFAIAGSAGIDCTARFSGPLALVL